MDARHNELLKEAVRLLVDRCPRLASTCYWAGTAVIAIEELQHRYSFDLDFHTLIALIDTRPLLAEIQQAFGDLFEIIHPPDEFGSSFRGLLALASGEKITIEVLSNYQDVAADELVPSTSVPGIRRVSNTRYLADKIQCVAERVEARDLVDIHAMVGSADSLRVAARRILLQQDALLLTERLLAWTDAEIQADLEAHPEVDPRNACAARDQLLQWLKEDPAG